MHSFSIAALTNYHKLSDLTQHKFIMLWFCGLEVQHKSHWAKMTVLARTAFLLEALG